MKQSTWVIVFILIALFIAALLLMAFKLKSGNKNVEKCPDGKTPIPKNGICPQESTGTNAVADSKGCIQPSSYANYQFPLKKGMKDGFGGTAISQLQHKLNIRFKTLLKEDGFWGCITENAVKENLGVTEIYTNNPIWNTPEPIKG